eukprot:CAMPEP_0178903780 /NCGR_PEP_ID=MMETSP0786-20121207/5340_1 /TAXON_ID=186022 /ORGANISM="Thalassionema frauenfeldii, Strain CCMP 1798" /LENGTH=359 /DNA_ID=CAMNT_0020575175 /DNA_START=181 /DNA_END=1260 /DNA_ORIENTATION=-
MVNLHGHISLRLTRRGISESKVRLPEPPPDPNKLLSEEQVEEKAQQLVDWWRGKSNVFCITGAGLSTESGIPDYRGHEGSYHRGHKPVIHQQYMESEYQRQRYWGRSMIGWSKFSDAKPNKGHVALANLERIGCLGVSMEDQPSFYRPEDEDEFYFSSGQPRKLAIMTQNVDYLHEQAGSKAVLHLHGRGHIVKCMNCGRRQDRTEFTNELKTMNEQWLEDAIRGYEESDLRADGDAVVKDVDYANVHIPNCAHCNKGFWKTDVVFFGDAVPKHRVNICQEAVENADGILVVGSSLAVHSAFRHVRIANEKGIPIAILNVGETRAEVEGLDNILKIEAPAGTTLELCYKEFMEKEFHEH